MRGPWGLPERAEFNWVWVNFAGVAEGRDPTMRQICRYTESPSTLQG